MRASWFVARVVVDVARAVGVDPDAVFGRGRSRSLDLARRLSYWLAHETSGCSWLELSESFDRHYATLISGACTAAQRIKLRDLDILSALQHVVDHNPTRDHFTELKNAST